ncbi:MAG: response regulator transcription factor [Bacteroidota bacterium]
MKSKIHWSIVDDDNFWIQFYKDVLQGYENWEHLTHATKLQETRQEAFNLNKVDVLFLDIHLDGQSGLDGIPFFRKQLTESAHLIMLTMDEDTDVLLKALQLGADGYILKSLNKDVFYNQIAGIEGGGAALSPLMARKIISLLNRTPVDREKQAMISPKEWQILTRLAEGDSYEMAAEKLHLSINTFRYYIKKIYKNLNVENRSSAVRWYLDNKKPII